MSEINWINLKVWPNTGTGSISPSQFNKAVDTMQSLALGPSINHLYTRNRMGTTITPYGSIAGAGSPPCPFDMTSRVVSSNLYVSFSPGTVNGVLPDNIFAGVTGSYSSGSTNYVSLTCTTDGKTITDSTLTIGTSAPTVQTPLAWSAPTAFSYLIGVIVDKAAFKTISCGNLTFEPTLVIQVPKASITPNIIPYDNYYNWLPTNGSG